MKKHSEVIIETEIKQLRDPFVLYADGEYYIYGTGWTVFHSSELNGKYTKENDIVKVPEDCGGCQWAPEVYKVGNDYIMVTTYLSKTTGRRGCSVFRSDSPKGKFEEISNGHVTPKEWDSIDGTLYFDDAGVPWMVFVHEWVSTDNNVGRMAVAQMSSDLTKFVSEPIELFTARDPSWANANVTDGCFIYKMSSGKLLMLWSNWDSEGYCVGIAESVSGSVLGPWIQQDERLFSKSLTGIYDGGHGMIFKDTNGRTWLSIHSPNSPARDRKEVPIFVPVKESDDTLVWDFER